jgi:MFS family permease
VKANDIGITALFIPLVYLIFNSMSVLFAVPMGILSDKFGREKLIIFGYMLYSVIYFGFGKTNSKILLILLFVLYGLYSASTDGIQKALVSDLIDKNKRGTGLGIYNSLIGITILPASLIAGVLYDEVNNRAPFYFGSVMALLAAVLMYVFYKKYGKSKETIHLQQ